MSVKLQNSYGNIPNVSVPKCYPATRKSTIFNYKNYFNRYFVSLKLYKSYMLLTFGLHVCFHPIQIKRFYVGANWFYSLFLSGTCRNTGVKDWLHSGICILRMTFDESCTKQWSSTEWIWLTSVYREFVVDNVRAALFWWRGARGQTNFIWKK